MPDNTFKSCGFHPIVEEWFISKYKKPSPPQVKGWPSIAAGNHTLILAPTGSGKTLAAFLWSIDQLVLTAFKTDREKFNKNTAGIHTLYISPLKALNNDIHTNLKEPLKGIQNIAKQTGFKEPEIRAAVRTGDTPAHVRQSMLNKPPHILITTPESLYLLITSERGRTLFKNLRYIIVDEIHAISGNKRGVHLSLSLERLMLLCDEEPLRIGLSATQKPLERIAAYLGGQKFFNNKLKARPVNIVDCGQRKMMDLKVITPVESFGDLPERSVWPPAYKLLYRLITGHRTTLIFVNMRAQTERIARELNELHKKNSADADAPPIVLAHHGSISRETRYEIEEKLKKGQIPAVIATASLELGIDIGSIDLVVQLEAPKSVSGGLQRVGRSGHLLSATSKGRIIPLYASGLDDALALSRCMLNSDIEETRIPGNALDVLAQQILAEVSMRNWEYDLLFNLIRQSYCYRDLSENLFNNVLNLLSGKYAGSPVQYLKPRLSWDRINNVLTTLRGARLISVLNGGTIPDRGYFSVRLKDGNVNLGEVEEEFVYETRVGEVFFLGNSEWRVDEIAQDRIIVTPVAAIKPKAPFWKGDLLYREFETSKKIGRFRNELIEQMESGRAADWLAKNFEADSFAINNAIEYFRRQKEHSGRISTDKNLVGEWTIDSGGEPLFFLHAPYGARVNGLWAIALSAALEKEFNTQVQYSFDDDGLLIRLLETSEPPSLEKIFRYSADETEKLIMSALPETPVFAVHFRYNAARSMILPRSQPGKRIPLWLQRLRASDLLQIARREENFPVILETYRECLYDVFDWQSLRRVIDDIQSNSVRIHLINTSFPSPMASGVLFKFIAVNMYEYDQDRKPGQARLATGQGTLTNNQLLSEILERKTFAAIITDDLISGAERRWQHLEPHLQARDAEELFNIIERLGPLDNTAVADRSSGDFDDWLETLKANGRILYLKTKFSGWVVVQDKELFSGELTTEKIEKLIIRYLRTHAPLSSAQISRALQVDQQDIEQALEKMRREKMVVCGRLIEGYDEQSWCDRLNFEQLYRKALSERRVFQKTAGRSGFYRFLLNWHGIVNSTRDIEDVLTQYQGYHFPLHFFERNILTTRLSAGNEQNSLQRMDNLHSLISTGTYIARTERPGREGRITLHFIPRGQGNIFFSSLNTEEQTGDMQNNTFLLWRFLRENGASFLEDIEVGLESNFSSLQPAFIELICKGIISCDDYASIIAVLENKTTGRHEKVKRFESNIPGAAYRNLKRNRPSRSQIKQLLNEKMQVKKGRWFLSASFAVMGKESDEAQQAEKQAKILLQRYGILVKEFYRRERGLLSWYQIFQALRRLEWQGEIRRGYFVEGLSGVQFALPKAVDLLEKLQKGEDSFSGELILLSTIDPALPFGGALKWDLLNKNGEPLKVIRSATNHIAFFRGQPLLYSENYASRLWILDEIKTDIGPKLAESIKNWLRLPVSLKPLSKIEITEIDGKPALNHELARDFLKHGFERYNLQLILWPSGAGL